MGLGSALGFRHRVDHEHRLRTRGLPLWSSPPDASRAGRQRGLNEEEFGILRAGISWG